MKIFLSLIITILISSNIIASEGNKRIGPYSMFEQIIYESKQKFILEHISNDCARGRATGTLGNQLVGKFIRDRFEEYGLETYNQKTYFQLFDIDSVKGVNVIGYIPSSIPTDKYIIVSAHYDHIGALNGFVYNGADDNASGVTALLNLAEIFGTMKKAKLGPDKNIIFVAFDAKELSMGGSRHFVKNLKLNKKQIIANINIDQVGSTLEPIHDNLKEYIVILGEKTLNKSNRGKIKLCNNYYDLNLDIDYTFYGSKSFTDLTYRLSDQVSFLDKKIPALYFTSGFHKHTYKISDDPVLIDYPVLKKRTLLIFYLIMTLS